MQKPSPISVIIDPPGMQFGMPGETLEVYVVVTNQSSQGAVIDVFFDEASDTLQQWCTSPRERLALGPQQNSELTFEFHIPIDALPGTYDYTLVVDAPEHFPEDTPIQFPRQLKVMLKEHTAVRVNDPTFSLKPTTNPRNPAIIKSKEALQIEVKVDNRSDRVDRFRLTIPDLEEQWYTIRYGATGVEGPGLLSNLNGLELNPNSQERIWLKFHPPADTFAGNYSPTIRLHSANSPDLVLLDLIYIQIPPIHKLDVELITLRGKVSNSSGEYQIKFTNQGNTPRELKVSIKSREEEQLFRYKCEPAKIRLLPHKSFKVNLTVTPKPWWRRPLFGKGLPLNFVTVLQDKQDLPVSEKLPEGTLIWNARPWWQFIPILLTILGCLGSLAFVVWLFFLKPPTPPKLVYFVSDSINYLQGDEVRLDWQIRNSDKISQIEIDNTGPVPAAPQKFDFNKGIPDKLKDECQIQQGSLSCFNYDTGVTQPGDYTFMLQVFAHGQDKAATTADVKVAIKEKPDPKVINFQLDKNQYMSGNVMNLSWQIQNTEQLSQLQVVGKADSGTENVLASYTPRQLQKLCQQTNQIFSCKNVPLNTPEPGQYTFELKAFSSNPGKQPNSQSAQSTISILPKPLKIISFTINGSQEPNIVLQPDQPVTLQWKVEGQEASVELDPFGSVPLSGSKVLTANQAFPSSIQLLATDKFGNKDSRGFSIKVNNPTPGSGGLQVPLTSNVNN
ncbi:hypothetical protein H6G76_21775 [Nostoc sp. FACHB-152]|uniref:COG1470 family protein n=1 Tax=unclassified Nostoc TaxID=2593658 RepID=UPI0016827963|nr:MULTISPECIES: hypothetical protein [unclassified Nostoc]MBD2449746.1 hypothetical protein [Nostoc sp. FACHB-152]MBD2469877.1 hypothetical protein [Nostoc sp. FACHB-145]